MSTCPRCHGHLTDTHRCPRRPLRVAVEIVAAALAGALAGLLALALIDPQGQLPYVGTALVTLGVFAGIGLDRLLRSW